MASAGEKVRVRGDGGEDGFRGEKREHDDDDERDRRVLSRRREFRGCRRRVASARETKKAQTNEKEKRVV